MKLKENSTAQKLRGGYYTPEILADFIVKNIEVGNKLNILEPSCGDGVFLESIKENIDISKIKRVDAIEIESIESQKVIDKKLGKKFNVINNDFLDYYHLNHEKKYNLILGNPPYIRYQYLSEKQRQIQSEILVNSGMKSNKLINSWVCFLVACIQMLDDNGKIAFVIPAELLQVAYAKDLRFYLSNTLAKITLITFNELVFPGIEQEVVVLIGEKNNKVAAEDAVISVLEFDNFKDMSKYNLKDNNNYQSIEHNKEKWTHYFLNSYENELITSFKEREDFNTFDEIAIVNVGITTGNNKYFSVDKDTVIKYGLKNVTLPLIGRSAHAHGIYFNNTDWNINVDKDLKSQLILFPKNLEYIDYPSNHKEYIELGEENEENSGYKCRIRNRWYIIPSVWSPDAFFLRRNNKFPKFVLNEIDAVSTDTMHRIKFNDGINKRKALLSYYNSISFAFTEICGRSYGGGVLEILPREVGAVILPDINNIDDKKCDELLEKIDNYIRNKKDIDELLDIVDKAILEELLNIDSNVIKAFRSIWKKMMNRRLTRSK